MKKLTFLGLLLLAFTVTGCQLYFGEEDTDSRDGVCLDDGYYVRGEWVSAQCPGGGNACTSHVQCAAGCFCADDSKTCEEGGFCSDDKDCALGYKCDDRSSCVPGGATCKGLDTVTCTNGAPRCPEGQVPLVEDGCYVDTTGDGQFDCTAIIECPEAPLCDAFQYTTDCEAASCQVITRGEDCRRTTDNTACRDGDPDCRCARYVFSRCETI